MKTIIAGSRGCTNMLYLHNAVAKCGWKITEVVSGGARGPDMMGEEWAFYQVLPVKRFPAEWDKLGKGAGYIRNAQMAEYADSLIALWDGVSRGTANMITLARAKGLKTYVESV